MPQITIMIHASTYEEAAEEAYKAIARTLSNPVAPDGDLVNAVKGAYTPVSIEARDIGRYRVILYGSFKDILIYKRTLETKQ